MCPCHTKTGGPLIHLLHELPLSPGYVLCHGHRSIVAGSHYNTLDHSLNRLHLSLFQKHLGSSHRLGIGAGYHFIRHLNLPGINGIKNQNQCHNLGNAGRTALSVCILLINHLAGGCFHKHCAGGRDLRAGGQAL